MNNYLSNRIDVATLVQPDSAGKMHISFSFPQPQAKKLQDVPFDLMSDMINFIFSSIIYIYKVMIHISFLIDFTYHFLFLII